MEFNRRAYRNKIKSLTKKELIDALVDEAEIRFNLNEDFKSAQAELDNIHEAEEGENL
jgi:hypothetical protein